MKKLLSAICVLCTLLAAHSARAGAISDVGANAYWGSNAHNNGDVIGGSNYDISGATITRVGSILTIVISTNFAGKASSATGGIGYGDLFLAQAWNPFGSDANHVSDNASNGTLWKWGLSLNNRYSNAASGNTFKLYQLNGSTNAANINNTDYYMQNCGGCTFRNGQVAGVKTNGSVTDKGLTGNFFVDSVNKNIRFEIDIKSVSALMAYTSFAMHWGETCGNDVIEGVASVVPVPGSLPLMAIGLLSLLAFRSREKFAFLRKSR